MSLRKKQSQFVRMVGQLIAYADSLGYELTFGDAYRSPKVKYGHARSLHRKRLAIDLNLFIDGKWMKKTKDFKALGAYWESIGGAWGGRFGDGNHFSLAHGGMR